MPHAAMSLHGFGVLLVSMMHEPIPSPDVVLLAISAVEINYSRQRLNIKLHNKYVFCVICAGVARLIIMHYLII